MYYIVKVLVADIKLCARVGAVEAIRRRASKKKADHEQKIDSVNLNALA